MQQIVLFLMTYALVFIFYYFFITRKTKKNNSKKIPKEVSYLVGKYQLDLKKIDYKKLLIIISLVSSLDITIIVTLMVLFESYLIKLLLAIVLIIPVIFISYHLVGMYYKKKGMTKNV